MIEITSSESSAKMSTTDKSVSTDELCVVTTNAVSEMARLEDILQTLVETKVEALKNDSRKTSSSHSSPKSILNRLRLASTSSQSTKGDESERGRGHVVDIEPPKKTPLKQDVLVMSSGHCELRGCDVSSNSGAERHQSLNTANENIYFDDNCSSGADKLPKCYCNKDGQIMSFDDDYISLKVETEAMLLDEALRDSRRKRRRRRKRRMKNRIAHHAHLVDPIELPEGYKNLTEDELSRRAKWTIIATACLLLFLCLLLVGITLRMAPIIDEIVRKENEAFINSINRQKNHSPTVFVRHI